MAWKMGNLKICSEAQILYNNGMTKRYTWNESICRACSAALLSYIILPCEFISHVYVIKIFIKQDILIGIWHKDELNMYGTSFMTQCPNMYDLTCLNNRQHKIKCYMYRSGCYRISESRDI